MKLNLRRAAALAAIVAAPFGAFAGDLAKSIPSDVVFAAWVEDSGALTTKWKASKYAELWNAPEMGTMRDLASKKIEEVSKELEGEIDVPLEDLLKVYTREIVVYAGSVTFPTPENGLDGPEPSDIVVAFDMKDEDRPTVQKLIDKMVAEIPADAKRRSYEEGANTVYSFEYVEEVPVDDFAAPPGADGTPAAPAMRQVPTTTQYAFLPGRFVLAEGTSEPIKRFLSGLNAPGGATSLTASERFGKALPEMGGAPMDVNIYFDYATLTENGPKGNPDEEKIRATMAGLGITGSGPMVAGMSLNERGASWVLANVLPTQKTGLFSLMYSQPPINLSAMSSVPPDAVAAGSWSLKGSQFMKDLRALLLVVSPESYGGLDFVLNMANSSTGANVENDIINNIDGEHLYYKMPLSKDELSKLVEAGAAASPAAAMGKIVFRLAFANGTNVVTTLDGVIAKAMSNPEQPLPIDKSEIQGYSNYRAKPEAGMEPGFSPSLTLTPAGAVFAFDDAVLQDALRRVAGKGTGSLAEDASLAAAISSLDRSELRAFAFNKEAASIESYAIQVGAMKAAAASGEIDAETAEFFNAMPAGDVLKGRVGDTWSGFWLKPNGLVIKSESLVK